MKFDILNRFSGAIQVSVEIECFADAPPSIKLGLAVRAAIKEMADLRSADLRSADLRSADLSSANLSSANLRSAKDAELPIARTRILPEGQLIGWKKLKDGSIAKLSIPAEARRSHSFGRKCRAEFVDVLEGEGVSAHDGITRYKPGKRVPCDKWEEDWTQECAGGIHFFITKIEAENH